MEIHNMNCCLLLSGMPRNIENSYKWLKESVLDVLDKNNIKWDIIISTWESSNTSKFIDIYKPKLWETEVWNDEMADKLGWQEFKNHNYELQSKSNTLGMLYKIYKCDELRKEYEKLNNIEYLCIIRARTELKFNNEIDINEINIISNHQDTPLVFLRQGPNPQFLFPNWTKDNFSIMNRKGADIYSDCFNNLLSISRETRVSTAELILRNWLDFNKVKVEHTSLDYSLTRG